MNWAVSARTLCRQHIPARTFWQAAGISLRPRHSASKTAARIDCSPLLQTCAGLRCFSASHCAATANEGIVETPKEAPATKKPFSIRPYMDLMRLDRPIGSQLLFWPCGLFAVGSVIMRGAGCTINDMWDAKIDAKVERTKNRPIPSGAVSYKQATVFLGLQLLCGLAILLSLNTYSIVLGALALGPVFAYPLMKRVTNIPQLGMGISFTWGSMLGWSAVAGACYWPAVLPLYASTVTWGIAYDTIYAHQDKVDDRATGVGSTAILFGDKGTKPALLALSAIWLALLAYAVNVQSPILPSFVAADGHMLSFKEWAMLALETGHPFFGMSWLTAVCHVLWQIRTVDLNNRADCWAKFCSNRTVGMIVFFGLAADFLYQYVQSHKKPEKLV